MSADRTKASGTFDEELWRSQSIGQSVKRERCSMDLAKRKWLAKWRQVRLAKLGSK